MCTDGRRRGRGKIRHLGSRRKGFWGREGRITETEVQSTIVGKAEESARGKRRSQLVIRRLIHLFGVRTVEHSTIDPIGIANEETGHSLCFGHRALTIGVTVMVEETNREQADEEAVIRLGTIKELEGGRRGTLVNAWEIIGHLYSNKSTDKTGEGPKWTG